MPNILICLTTDWARRIKTLKEITYDEDRKKRAEESIQKKYHKQLFSPFAKACKIYKLIE